MKSRWSWAAVLALGWVFLVGETAWAQPGRVIPGSRPGFPSSPPPGLAGKNPRVRPAAQTGEQSADLYAKNGYPKMLGDGVEQGSSAQGSAQGLQAGASGIGGGIGGGVSGGGFQGNIGNQIGSNTGGTIFGGIFGGGGGGGGLSMPGVSGGGFTGVLPKGFGFGGSPDLTSSSTAPLRGGTSR